MADKLIDKTISTYLDELASNAPAPGGGAASALAGAQGCALISMVANLTIGKKKYADLEEHNISVREASEKQRAILTAGIDEDKEAFTAVSAAYKLPHVTEENKAARSEAISEASIAAAQAPLKAVEASLECLIAAKSLVGRSNPNLASDIYVGAVMLIACVRGAKGNVEVNLPGIHDRDLADDLGRRCKIASEEAEKVYKNIIKELKMEV